MRVMESFSPTRLHGHWLWLARLVWLAVFLMAAGKLVIGLPLFYAEKARVCTSSTEVCSQSESLNLDQVRELESAGISLTTYAKAVTVFAVINLMIWSGIGVFIFLLRSDDWLALIASAMMILYTSGGYDRLISQTYPELAVLSDFIFTLQNILLFLFIGLFPNGRFAPSWIRWYWLGMVAISIILQAGFLKFSTEIEFVVITILWVSFLILGPYSQIYRYRNVATPVQRQQTKWVVLGFVVMAGFILLLIVFTFLSPDNSSLSQKLREDFYFDAAGLLIPLSIGISVLRYRLWDIDVIIRRTLVYTVLTTFLALVYFGGVVVIQGVLRAITGQAGQSEIAIVVSTLGIAALFNPLRRRIQDFIDRRFYRQRYNAEQTLAEFAATARESADLENLTARLMDVVGETMQPSHLSLWLKPTQQRTAILPDTLFPEADG